MHYSTDFSGIEFHVRLATLHTNIFDLYLNSGIMSKPLPLVRKSRRLESARISIFFCESQVSVPIWGSSVALGNSSSRGFTCGSSGNTSRPTAPN